MKMKMLLIVLCLFLVGCKSDVEGEVVSTRASDNCEMIYSTNTNQTVSGRVFRCNTPDGVLYIYEGIGMEFAPQNE